MFYYEKDELQVSLNVVRLFNIRRTLQSNGYVTCVEEVRNICRIMAQ